MIRQNAAIPVGQEERTMKLVKRTAVIVIPKQPYIDWANSVDDDDFRYDENPPQEHTIYLVDDMSEYIVDTIDIIKPYYQVIFEEELNGWHRVVSDWPPNRDLDMFLKWFEVQVHSVVIDLHPGRLRTERY